MAFPVVAASNSSVQNSTVTSHTVNLPSGISAGDLLVMIFANSAGTTSVSATGWSFFTSQANGSSCSVTVGYKTATGSEGSTVTVTTGVTKRSAHVTYRITGWSGTPEIATATGGSDNTPDPPSLTPSWGAMDTLWIAACGTDGSAVCSAGPSGYSNFLSTRAGTPNAVAGGATRQVNASSEDPPGFTVNLDFWVAQTVAIKPAIGRSFGIIIF